MTAVRAAALLTAAALCILAWLLWPDSSAVRPVQYPSASSSGPAPASIEAATSHDGGGRESVEVETKLEAPMLRLVARLAGGEVVAASFGVEDQAEGSASRELGESGDEKPLTLPADFATLPAAIHAFAEIGGELFRGRTSLNAFPLDGECVVELEPTLSIVGTVVYPGGKPVGAGFVVIGSSMQGTVVAAPAPDRIDPLGHFARTTTDSRGEFLLRGFATDTNQCLLQSLGSGWGTNSWPTKAAVVPTGATDVQLVVHPLFAALLRERPQVGDGTFRSLAAKTGLSVDHSKAPVVYNYLVLEGPPEPGWVLHVYTAPTEADSIPATLHCGGLDPAATRTAEVEIPRWHGGPLARLQDESCGVSDDLVQLDVVIVGGLGWDQLRPQEEIGDFVLGWKAGSGVGASLTAGDLSKGSARFWVPRGRYHYMLRLSSLSRHDGDISGEVDALSDDNVLVIDLTDTGALMLDVRWEDGTPFVGGVSASFIRVFQVEENAVLPNGMPGRNFQGFGSQQRWRGPPYLAPTLVPGNYAVTLHSSTLQYRAFRPARPIELVTVEAGKLSVHELRYVSEAD